MLRILGLIVAVMFAVSIFMYDQTMLETAISGLAAIGFATPYIISRYRMAG